MNEREVLYREQLDPQNPDDAEWVGAVARSGRILVISGDHLHIADTSLELHTAA
ncbi:hypothetical protein [Arthrobacter globiformis]|uniref:hypothetical protein n=1 Tax=Arthrobacter globiformis TaxID=1665 RepID=UPI0027D7D58A|nr:hypothetical protein [Arthrobacter globiformis]